MKQLYIIMATLFVATLSFAQNINLTVTVPEGTTSVSFTGPWWGWDPNNGPVASDKGDNTWTVNMNAGGENMEYLWIVDGVQENLIDNAANAECPDRIDAGTLITDYANYANRVWLLDSGDVSGDIYDSCAINILSIGNFSESTLILYPNPVQNTLNVSAGVSVDQVSIFDLTGREVMRATPNASAFSLDVANLNKGLYLVSLKAGDKEMTTKLVK